MNYKRLMETDKLWKNTRIYIIKIKTDYKEIIVINLLLSNQWLLESQIFYQQLREAGAVVLDKEYVDTTIAGQGIRIGGDCGM